MTVALKPHILDIDMAKKKQAKSTQPKSFRLQGNYARQTIVICLVADLIIGFVLGFLLQPTIVAFVTASAAKSFY